MESHRWRFAGRSQCVTATHEAEFYRDGVADGISRISVRGNRFSRIVELKLSLAPGYRSENFAALVANTAATAVLVVMVVIVIADSNDIIRINARRWNCSVNSMSTHSEVSNQSIEGKPYTFSSGAHSCYFQNSTLASFLLKMVFFFINKPINRSDRPNCFALIHAHAHISSQSVSLNRTIVLWRW